MFGNFRRKLSVRLSLFLTCVVVPSLVVIGALATAWGAQSTKTLVLREAETAAISGAAAYGQILDEAVDSKQLTLDEVLLPAEEEMRFSDPEGNPIQVEDARYRTKVGDYAGRHGVQRLQDSIMDAGGFLFSSGMTRTGLVLVSHKKYDHPPKGIAKYVGNPPKLVPTPEFAAWDRDNSRANRKYDKPEQVAAAGFTGNPKSRTLIQDYSRDTGEPAWDVAAPIFVKGRHFGGFRVGVSRDRIAAQQRELVVGLSLLFGLLAVVTVLSVFLASWAYIRPLTDLTATVNRISRSESLAEFGERIVSTEVGEVGDMARAANRLRAAAHDAIVRLEAVPRAATQTALVLAVFLAAAAAAPSVARADVLYRSFSSSAAIGPPAEAFAEKLRAVTRAALGASGELRFAKLPGVPAVPARFAGDVVAAVSAGEAGGGYDAAYVPGGDLNRAWGFVFNSGVPFGPTFDEFLGFLYGPGLPLTAWALDRRGVVAFPVVGGTEQLSGYFPEPLSDAGRRRGIGLAGLCQRAWVLRFLPPGENVIGQACDDMVSEHKIPRKGISFVQAVSGSGSLVEAAEQGTLNGFEFASPLDDESQLFGGRSNPATVGLRYVHAPGWHQQFLITWMVVNRRVWSTMSTAQQVLFQTVARDSVLSSYADNLRQQGPALQAILSSGVTLSRWPARDLALLRDATIQVINRRTFDASFGPVDRAEYARIIEALRLYVRANNGYWSVRRADGTTRFDEWVNPAGERWSAP